MVPSRVLPLAFVVALHVVTALDGEVAQDTSQGADPGTPGAAGPPSSSSPSAPIPPDMRRDLPADVAPAASATPNLPAKVLETVEFQNKTYFRDETLRSFLLHPIPGELDDATLHADADRIADRYRDRGFLKAKVTVAVVDTTPPRGVKAVFHIDAGERAELKRVKVVGNVNVPESELKEGFFSRPPEPLGFLTRAGFFHRPFLDQDGQRLVANYYKRGYLEARVLDSWVEADPTLDGLSVTMRVVEGPVYELAGIRFAGDIPKDADEKAMRSRITVKDGDVCDLVSIQQQADALLDPLRAEGHPFAHFEQAVQVATPPSGNAQHRAVLLLLKFVAGPTPIVRHVLIAGNKGTQDRVIRRDIAIQEGARYDFKAAKKTEHDLMLTGFFAQVQAVPQKTEDENVIDVVVNVVEQQTYLISVAPAFDSTEGLIGVGILADRNFLGTGVYVSTFARLSSLKQTFDLTVSEPRFLDTHIILTGGLHRREISYPAFRVRSDIGGDVRVSVPLDFGSSSGVYVGGGIGVEYGGVVLYDKKPPQNDPFTGPQLDLAANKALLPSGVFRNPLSLSIAYDKRDNILTPRNGVYAALSSTYAGPLTLSGLNFIDTGAQLKLFWSPIWNITLKANTDVGRIFNPAGGDVPVTDRYFLGGLGSVRGYPILSLSPSRSVNVTSPLDSELNASLCAAKQGATACNVDVGGVARAVQNFEIEFPLWPDTPFRGFTFFDMGNAFDDVDLDNIFSGRPIARNKARTPLPLNLYYSTGFGFLIETPVAPFRFEWSVPLTKRPGIDQPISFFLGVGSAF